jgi:hypothetical protein
VKCRSGRATYGSSLADPIWRLAAPALTREQLRFVISWIASPFPMGDTPVPRRHLELPSLVVVQMPSDHDDVEELGLVRAMTSLAAAGASVLGHVETGNGCRPLTAVTTEIVRWLKHRLLGRHARDHARLVNRDL